MKMLIPGGNPENTPPLQRTSSNKKSIRHSPRARNMEFQDEQILTLRQQNAELERTLISVRQELKRLKEIEKKQSEEQWKTGMPFFELNEDIEGLYTKLDIGENDYDKIDHLYYKANLELDKLTIQKKGKNTTPQELDLTDLESVSYIYGTVMFLKFQNQEHEKSNLFIKFNNAKDLHRWDLAIYINYEIIKSMPSKHLFEQAKKSQNANIFKDLEKMDEKQLLKLVIEREKVAI